MSKTSGAVPEPEEAGLLRSVVSRIDQGILVVDRAGRIVFANPGAADSIGVPRHLLERQTLDAIVGSRRQGGDQVPIDLEMMLHWRDLAAGRESIPSDWSMRYDRPGPCAGHWCEARVLDDGSQIWCFADVTDLKRAALDALDARQDADRRATLVRLALEGMDHGVEIRDADDRLVVFNDRLPELAQIPREMFERGASTEELLAFAQRHQSWTAEAEAWRRAVRAWVDRRGSRAAGEVLRADVPGREPGTWRQVIYRQLDHGIEIRTWLDVTHEREAEREAQRAKERAEAAHEAKSLFFAMMCHEIRTPMSGILGLLDLLERQPDSEDRDRMLRSLRESATAMLATIDDVLDLSRIEAGRLDLELVPMSLRQTVQAALDVLAPEAERKGLALTVAIEDRMPDLVVGDPVRLRQVLLNLIGNAVKFTAEGSVSVRCSGDPEQPAEDLLRVRFEIEDTGAGLEDVRVERLFEPYRQAGVSTARDHGGAGLGLAIVYRLVTLMGGTVAAEPSAGGGALFRAVVPLRLAAGPPEGASVAARSAPRILVAEDHPINREVIARQLRLLDCDFDLASNGEEAYDLWVQHRHGLVFVDLQMPVMDGFALVARIREAERNRGTRSRIVALTALPADADRSLSLDLDDYLAKPVDLERLRGVLSLWLPSAADPHLASAGPGLRETPPVEEQQLPPLDREQLTRLIGADAPAVDALLAEFERETERLLAALREAAHQGDLPTVRKLAHQMKGSAITIGARQLAHAALALERVAANGERDLSAQRLAAVMDSAETVLQAIRGDPP